MRHLSRLAVVAAMTLLAAACGSSNNNSGGTSATSTAPTTGGGAGAAEIDIQGFQYTVPASVAPGAAIKIVNKDAPAHTVTSPKGAFNTEVPGNGTATFTAPGTAGSYDIVCNFHPNMKGKLVVK